MKKSTFEKIFYGTLIVITIISIILGCYQWYLDVESKKAIIEIGKAQTQFISGEEYSRKELLK